MLGALLSQDIALDLGSARTRLHLRGAGCVVDVPTVVAVRTRRSGRREVIAVGDAAQAMLGRTPDNVVAVRPVRAGRVVEPEVLDAMLAHLVQGVHGRRSWIRPRVLVTAPSDAPDLAVRAVRDACEGFGAREVQVLPQPVAVAAGAGLAQGGTSGHMVVDIGAGTAHIAVLCMDGVVVSTTLDVAGDVLDGAVIRMLRREHALMVGAPTAERLKQELCAAVEPDDRSVPVAGRCLRTGVPRSVDVHAREISTAVAEPIAAIGAGIRRVLEQTPPEIASDVVDHGVILCGGGSLVRNLDHALRASTGLAMLLADAPDRVVIRGAGEVLDHRGVFERSAVRRAVRLGRALPEGT
jgi:rod shape-determining protein MreB